jgi:ribonuclease VapC
VNSSKVVLDASAILALIYAEAGSERLTPELLTNALVSSVNLAEVHSKLVAKGWDVERAWQDCTGIANEVQPFSAEQAKTAGALTLATRSLGLSLGDRACLALALSFQASVYTADRSWKNLKLGIQVHVIR